MRKVIWMTAREVEKAHPVLTERRLRSWRLRGGGPRFYRLGRRTVRYLAADVSAFLARCRDDERVAA